MCTVTWRRTVEGYVLFFNRDERVTRRAALGPQQSELRGVKYVAPVDGDHGGSWIGVNEFGVTLCLLNRYNENENNEGSAYVSRGLLLIDLLDCVHTSSLQDRLHEFDLRRFRPFTLLGLTKGFPAIVMHWNGLELSIKPALETEMPLTSSSAREPGIAVERARQYAAFVGSAELDDALMDRFHRTHLPQRGAYSVCMHRAEASTVSLSKVTVSEGEVEFHYEGGPPCESNGDKAERVMLPLRRAPTAFAGSTE